MASTKLQRMTEAGIEQVSFRVEQRLDFSCGHVEIRRYCWSEVDDVIAAEADKLIVNMALTTRPARTRMAPVGSDAPPRLLGRVMLLMPGQRYRLEAPSGSLRSIQCALERGRLEALLGDQIDWDAWWLDADSFVSSADIEALLGRIYREMRLERLGRSLAVESYVNALCVELSRRVQQWRPASQGLAKGGLAPWRLKLVHDRVGAQAPSPRIAELAALCGLTERQLGRAFKAETGQTIGRYIDEVTIERARQLLTATDRTIAEVASELGFASAASFAQAFRRIAGIAPNDLRRR